MDRRRHRHSIRRSRFGHDRFVRARAHPGAVPGGIDVLSGGVRGRRTGWPGRVCLRVRLPARVLLGERSIVIVPGHVAVGVGERVCIPLRACIPLPDPIRVPEAIPVSFPVRVGVAIGEHIAVGTYVFVPARLYAGEHLTVRIGIRFPIVAVSPIAIPAALEAVAAPEDEAEESVGDSPRPSRADLESAASYILSESENVY
jgi:hypothetical protein